MIDELEGVWKEEVVAWPRCYPGMFPGRVDRSEQSVSHPRFESNFSRIQVQSITGRQICYGSLFQVTILSEREGRSSLGPSQCAPGSEVCPAQRKIGTNVRCRYRNSEKPISEYQGCPVQSNHLQLYYSFLQFKSMRLASRRKDEKCIQNFDRKIWRLKPFGRLTYWWEVNFKTDLGETWCQKAQWIRLAH
jgi:hypothetical protein